MIVLCIHGIWRCAILAACRTQAGQDQVRAAGRVTGRARSSAPDPATATAGSTAAAGRTPPCATVMIAMPAARPTPRPRYASASARTVRPAYQAATSVPCPEPGPSPARLAGISSPPTTLIALLFRAVLSTAAPRPRRARYTADTAFGKLV